MMGSIVWLMIASTSEAFQWADDGSTSEALGILFQVVGHPMVILAFVALVPKKHDVGMYVEYHTVKYAAYPASFMSQVFGACAVTIDTGVLAVRIAPSNYASHSMAYSAIFCGVMLITTLVLYEHTHAYA